MRLQELVATSAAVARTSGRLEKIGQLTDLLRRLEPAEVRIAVSYLSGSLPQGRIGIGGAVVSGARPEAAAKTPGLDLREVDATFDRIARVTGAGSAREKTALLRDLLSRATRDEQDFLVRLLFGDLRQGALEGVMLEAVARASGIPPAMVRRAAAAAGDLVAVAEAALADPSTSSGSTLRPFDPSTDTASPQATPTGDSLRVAPSSVEGREAEGRPEPGRGATESSSREAAGGTATSRAETGSALARFVVQLFRPVGPMLADAADGVDEALERLGEAALEYKIDGARIQVHKAGHEVRVYSRTLREVTPAVPEVVEIVRQLPAGEMILDGEVVALGAGGRPEPFQLTMQRFGRKLDVERLRQERPLTPFFFDALALDGGVLIDEPQARRFEVLTAAVPPALVIPHVVAASVAEAGAFLDRAMSAGHEGVMAKSRDAAYAAGSRGQAWLKVKPARTLDLVVLAAEWGNGRRQGWLSNLHLGARDTEHGGFVMLGKTFKGLTDEMLKWQTEKLLSLEIARERYVVHVRPELVVEIAFNDLQASPRYPGGLALRFARVKRYRTDKPASEADTFVTVQDLYRHMTGRG